MIPEEQLLEAMEQAGFDEFVYWWKPEEGAFAIGVENVSILFLPMFDRVAAWPYHWPHKVRYFSSQEWAAFDDTDIEYRNLKPEWWVRFKPVFLLITNSFPADPLPSGFMRWIQGHRNVRWNKGVKVKRVRPPMLN